MVVTQPILANGHVRFVTKKMNAMTMKRKEKMTGAAAERLGLGLEATTAASYSATANVEKWVTTKEHTHCPF